MKQNETERGPLISVIMPAYNAEAFIDQAIKSVLEQTYKNLEFLIADDGSEDKTRKIIDSYAKKDNRIKPIHNETNKGYLKSCNKLFAHAKGDLITFQDADDWSEPKRFEQQLDQFRLNKNLGLCGVWVNYYSLKGKLIKSKRPRTTYSEIKEEIYIKSQFCGASIMIRNEVLKKVGFYRDFFTGIGNEDYDWSSRIVEKFEAINVPEVLYNVRVVPGSLSKNKGRNIKFFSENIVKFLAFERKQYGKDSLEFVNPEVLNAFIDSMEKPYLEDPSKKFREVAFLNFYSGLFLDSIKYSWQAIKVNPLKIINWKVFFSISFKSITH